GIGEREMFVASDAGALVRHTRRVVYLDDGEVALVRADGFETATLDGGPTAKTPSTIAWTNEAFDKGEYAHFMQKEIAEQPEAVERTLSGRLEPRFQTTHLGGIELAARELLAIRRVKNLGVGARPHPALRAACAATRPGGGSRTTTPATSRPRPAPARRRRRTSPAPASEFRYRN